MATLALNTDQLRDRIALVFFGGNFPSTDGGAYDAKTEAERLHVNRLLESALRRFYKPVLPKIGLHNWSFLRPWTTLILNAEFDHATATCAYDHTGGASERLVTLTVTTWPSWFTTATDEFCFLRLEGVNYRVASYIDTTHLTLTEADNPGADVAATNDFALHQSDYVLPSDVESVDGPMTFKDADDAEWPCRKCSPETIELYRMQSPNFGDETPRLFAIRALARTETESTKQSVIFWPDINTAATALFRYQVRPNALANDDGYPYGAIDHSETILESCLAIVEEQSEAGRGVHYQAYQELLAASVLADSRVKRVETFGYHGPATARYGGRGGRVTDDSYLYTNGDLPHYTSV